MAKWGTVNPPKKAVEVKKCDSCTYIDICKHSKQRESVLLEFNNKLSDLLGNIPDWVILSPAPIKLRCNKYKQKPHAGSHCYKCKYAEELGCDYRFFCLLENKKGTFTTAARSCGHFVERK